MELQELKACDNSAWGKWGLPTGLRFKGLSVMVESDNKLRATYTRNDINDKWYGKVDNADEAELVSRTGTNEPQFVYLESAGIPAAELYKVHTFVITHDESGTTVNPDNYVDASAYTYCSWLGYNMDPESINLGKALYRYGEAARAFFPVE